MKVCYKAGAVTAKENYYSIAADAVEIRLWFLTDEILRIRAGFDGDWDEASYSLVMTAWDSRADEGLSQESGNRKGAVDGRRRQSGDPGRKAPR